MSWCQQMKKEEGTPPPRGGIVDPCFLTLYRSRSYTEPFVAELHAGIDCRSPPGIEIDYIDACKVYRQSSGHFPKATD